MASSSSSSYIVLLLRDATKKQQQQAFTTGASDIPPYLASAIVTAIACPRVSVNMAPPKEEEDLYKVTAAAPFETCVFRLRVARCVQLDPSVTGRVAVVAAAFSMSMASLFWPASRSRPPSKKDT